MRRNKLNLRGERSHGETYKTLMKEIEEDKKNWKDIHVHGLEESNC